MKPITRLATVVVIATLPLSLAACGSSQKSSEKAAEEMLEQGAGGDVDVDVSNDGESVTIKGDDGSTYSSGKSVTLPSSFPSTVPTPSGKLITAVTESGSFTLAYEVDDFAKEMISYADSMSAAGYSVDVEYTTSEMVSRGWTDGTWSVTAIGSDDSVTGEGMITLAVSPV